MILALVASLVLGLAVAFVARPALGGTLSFWLGLAAPYALVAVYAGRRLQQRGQLAPLLRLRGGDLTLGAALGGALLITSWLGRTTLIDFSSPQQAWLINVYLQLGDPALLQGSAWATALLLVIVASDTLIFRGWTLDLARQRLGERRAWIAASLLSALPALPTLYTLAAPRVGLNPLPLVGALFGGLVLCFVARLVGRLPPVFIAQAVFAYFSVAQFRIPG